MKTQHIYRIAFLFILIMGWMTVKGQQQWEVPGDNFSLEGALEIFKKSASPEEFERMLNDPEARVNNLDLNGDGYIDYIRVIDMYEGNVHAFVLQAVISERQSQDIAVITLEKLADGRAILQITGDADIYGVETIIEPTTEVRTYAGANRSRVIVNVWAWPMVRYVYGPYYRVWVSPWGWGYRPYWWSPWRPVFYYDYYAFWSPYRSYYSVCFTHRVYYAHRIYRPHRTTSVIVYENHHHRIKKYRSTYIDSRGRYQPRDNRYPSRRNESVRFTADGRIASDANGRTRSGSSSGQYTGQRSSSSRYSDQRSSSARYNDQRSTSSRESNGNLQRSPENSRSGSGNYNVQRGTGRTDSDARLRTSERSIDRGTSNDRSVENANTRRSYGNTETRSYSGNMDSRGREADVQRQSSRPSGNANIQRSPQRSGSPSAIQRSSGSSNSRPSYQKPSGNSGSRYSQGSSSGSRSNIQRSTPSRSSGNTNSRSSGSSSQRSSSNQRSSGRR